MLKADTTEFLRWLVSKRTPNLMPLIAKSRDKWLSGEEKKQLISIVREELSEEGVDQSNQPTRYGKKLLQVVRELEHAPRLTHAEMSLLEQLVSERAPHLTSLVATIGHEQLGPDERERLRRVVSEEFMEKGLQDDHEPTSYGRQLDDLIGALGRV